MIHVVLLFLLFVSIRGSDISLDVGYFDPAISATSSNFQHDYSDVYGEYACVGNKGTSGSVNGKLYRIAPPVRSL